MKVKWTSRILIGIFLFPLLLIAKNGEKEKAAELEQLRFSSALEEAAFIAYQHHEAKPILEYFLLVNRQAYTSDWLNRDLAYIQSVLQQLNRKRNKLTSEKRFLEFLFYKVHRKFLLDYQPYSSFGELVRQGKYDCLSGTALYAYMLTQLDIPFQIIETKYHIYLLVKGAKQDYLIESTNFYDGFVSDPERISELTALYEKESKQGAFFDFNFQGNKEITVFQLVGLHYFNQAVKFYNQKKLEQAFNMLQKGTFFYQSPRFQEFMGVIFSEISSSQDLEDDRKSRLLQRYLRYYQIIASL